MSNSLREDGAFQQLERDALKIKQKKEVMNSNCVLQIKISTTHTQKVCHQDIRCSLKLHEDDSLQNRVNSVYQHVRCPHVCIFTTQETKYKNL